MQPLENGYFVLLGGSHRASFSTRLDDVHAQKPSRRATLLNKNSTICARTGGNEGKTLCSIRTMDLHSCRLIRGCSGLTSIYHRSIRSLTNRVIIWDEPGYARPTSASFFQCAVLAQGDGSIDLVPNTYRGHRVCKRYQSNLASATTWVALGRPCFPLLSMPSMPSMPSTSQKGNDRLQQRLFCCYLVWRIRRP